MTFVFPEAAIEFLRSCQYDPAAHLGYELLSGALIWSDEQYKDFLKLCLSQGCHHYGALFAYRTSLINGQPREEYWKIWEEVQLRCPEWIGFRAGRVTPSSELQDYLRKAEDDM